MLISLILSILPGIFIIYYIYNKDKYEKEPFYYIAFCFLFGVLSCIPAILGTLSVEYWMGVPDPPKSLDMKVVAFYAFVAVALSEELAKYIFLRCYIYRKEAFNEPMDGIVYAVVIGMGFAIVENILYVIDGGIQAALVRMFTAVPGHATFGVIMGYYVGLAKFEPRKNQSIKLHLQGVLLAIGVHGTYDFFIFQNNYALLSVLAFVVLFASIRMSKQLIQQHLDNSPYQ
ncbi:PrsW family intramembrane metalloprotease [Aureispira anguillae]|uniref:Protease PrsW n=1 Tax=Aureispira anguillae TaxID=2864201 RepID=A0A915YF41_9BACT|nr:PrsW family intramembrane metalloprotease [Aureispira anguillae]BDS11969.1 PrsW family intramembrane metalloprotease [Aureispira anguillae]